ncbi:hypothetical protein ATB53_13710 [Xanthomonas translucens]|uniref:Uncharacterized protein n=1 Tax=Xanthomonas campestris pv. translucens TaxID=343 RepID=A0A109HMG0_XANCT|nr:hypothetical protein [Xanthomonas translucens]KWV14394.1 hypothetical protein ATB53_13710 [Xanthomonas translucens]KWV14636.1 hypothetical protein ATB54_11685 [Xanthomonas translucens]
MAAVVDVHALVVAHPDPAVTGAPYQVDLQLALFRLHARPQLQGVAVEPALPDARVVQRGPDLAVFPDQQLADPRLRRLAVQLQPDRSPGAAAQPEHADRAGQPQAAVAALLDVRVFADGQRLHPLRHVVRLWPQQVKAIGSEDPYPVGGIQEQSPDRDAQPRVAAQQPALVVVMAQLAQRAEAPQRSVRRVVQAQDLRTGIAQPGLEAFVGAALAVDPGFVAEQQCAFAVA